MKVVLFLACLVVSFIAAAQSQRPNIVLIFSDDHAYQAISAYGNKLVQTPNIDRIAHTGALLQNNFVANSLCGPSRATLLTGKFSHKNGYYDNGGTPFNINQLVFPQLLQSQGYQTAWIGKMHLNTLPNSFDYLNILAGAGGQGTYFNPEFVNNSKDTVAYRGYVTDLISNFFFDWMQSRDASKPFFAVVGEKATHREWFPDVQDLGAYDNIEFPLPDDFFDNYDTRLAAQQQDMTVDKTMRLKEDLKVNQPFGLQLIATQLDSFHSVLAKRYAGKQFTDEDVRLKRAAGNGYARMNADQAQAYQNYYGKISREFESKHLSGKDLVKWKFERYLKDYYATAKSMDRNIGKILDYLDSTGLSKNTVVIYASDQGFYLGEHGWFDKRFMYDESFKTAFLIRYPGKIKPGIKIDNLISNVDWAPTILDIAGIKTPGEMQGKSFLPLLEGDKNANWQKDVYYHYYEYPEPHHVSPHFGLRTNDYLLIRFYKGVESWELFDLEKDPEELHNIYKDSKYKNVIADLKDRLKQQIIKYDDKDALEIFNKPL